MKYKQAMATADKEEAVEKEHENMTKYNVWSEKRTGVGVRSELG